MLNAVEEGCGRVGDELNASVMVCVNDNDMWIGFSDIYHLSCEILKCKKW